MYSRRINPSSNWMLGKKGEGGDEGLTLFGVMFALTVTFILVFAIVDLTKNASKSEERIGVNLQDGTRVLNSILSMKHEGEATLYDALLLSSGKLSEEDSRANYDVISRKISARVSEVFGESACFELYIDGANVYGTNMALQCNAKIDAETTYPAYGKELTVRMIIG